MKRLELKRSNRKKDFEWMIWPQAYFDMATIGCGWLMETIGNEKYGASGKSEIYQSTQPSQYLVLPIIYNFKHGIELYLKGLLIIFHGEYDNNSHNLIDLLDLLISKVQEREKSLTQKTKVLQVLDDEAREIIERYYFGLYFGKNRYKNHPDIGNQVERYPEIKHGDAYGIPDSLSCWVQASIGEERPLEKIDIESIKGDIVKLRDLLRNAAGRIIGFEKIRP